MPRLATLKPRVAFARQRIVSHHVDRTRGERAGHLEDLLLGLAGGEVGRVVEDGEGDGVEVLRVAVAREASRGEPPPVDLQAAAAQGQVVARFPGQVQVAGAGFPGVLNRLGAQLCSGSNVNDHQIAALL